MPTRPLLILPRPNQIAPRPGPRGGSNPRFPSKERQISRFGPVFNRLRSVLNNADAALELRSDPTSLAPDRVIVFEIGGTIANFLRAISKIRGLEFMVESESEFAADENFAVRDTRRRREGQDRADVPVPGRFYLAMPDTRALEELMSLWERWRADEPMDRGFAPFRDLFNQLRDLHPWGPLDRIPDDTIAYWREEARQHPNEPVRTELELWFRQSEERRRQASQTVNQIVASAGGRIVHEVVIPEIAYHGALVDIPPGEIQSLMTRGGVRLARADDVMFLRPQSMCSEKLEIETTDEGSAVAPPGPTTQEPIAALLDGVPLQGHAWLDGRIVLDDPDDFQSRAVVDRRVHGTAMASLILHGDRNENGPSIGRRLYVRPLMVTNDNDEEETDRDRLLIDTIYRAVVRMKGSESEEAAAPSVFLINLSMADSRRPFAGLMSPLAKLLDFLSDRYNVLFLVSGGNVKDALVVPGFDHWTAFEQASPEERKRAVLRALHDAKHKRTILSPAESVNALTIGGQHHDGVTQRVGSVAAIDPFDDNMLPNITSGLGLGYRRTIKPEIYLPGGREFVRMRSSGGGLEIESNHPQRLFGLKAAAPDVTGRLNNWALGGGTSSATAMATRAGHQIFEALMDREGGSLLADMDPQYYAVLVKCLLVHSARWNGNDELLKEICGPDNKRRFVERGENSCRFIGFGVPNIAEVLECDENRATLVGYGALSPESAHDYRIPLPACLEHVTDPRSLTVTVAWFSPVMPARQSYRCVRLEAAAPQALEELGVERRSGQPADASIKRGTVFHEHFDGEAAVPFINDGHLALQVWCKEDAGLAEPMAVRYAVAVTIYAGARIPIYNQIQERLRVQARAAS
jgi:hypothetical protein